MRLFTMAMMSLLAVSAYAKGDSSQSSSTKDRYSTQATLSQGGLRRTTNTPLFPLRGSPTTMPKKMGRSKPGAGKAKRKPKLTMAELENELKYLYGELRYYGDIIADYKAFINECQATCHKTSSGTCTDFKLTALVYSAYHDIHVANGKHVYIQTCIKSLQETIMIKQHALDKIAEYQMEMANTADDREGSSNASPDHISSPIETANQKDQPKTGMQGKRVRFEFFNKDGLKGIDIIRPGVGSDRSRQQPSWNPQSKIPVLHKYKPTVHEEETKQTPTNDIVDTTLPHVMSESPKSSGITRGSGIPSRTKPVSSVKGPQKIQQATTTVKSSRKEPKINPQTSESLSQRKSTQRVKKHDVSSTPKSQPKWVY
ncbi:hypothetical protein BASA62_003673 [Batrachochytrium salamandrivorans]|nr:hypothetical protein BASA62_003673 [Batrachochytrium salamandrivorans]